MHKVNGRFFGSRIINNKVSFGTADSRLKISPDICAKNYNIPIVRGCVTPSEIEMAMQYGIETVKFFPAETYGGVKGIKALSAPYRHIRFIPTGGINESNLASYLNCKTIVACGGSFMMNQTYITEGNFDEIQKTTAQAMDLVNSIVSNKK